MIALFWTLVGLLAYAYVGYGLLVILLARLAPRRKSVPPERPLRVTLFIAAYNEARHIGRKIENALALPTGPHEIEVVVVSDGSTDGTADIVRSYADRGVRCIDLPEHQGKIPAMNAALPQLEGDVVIFSDANSALRDDAILQLVRHFGDPRVGGVCGQLTVPKRKRSWLGRGEALYWAYDHALKAAENRLGGAVSAQGSLYAVRRRFLAPLPSAVTDDFLNSVRAVAAGARLVFEPNAVAEEEVSQSTKGEFARRVRSTERGWRAVMLMAPLLNPFRTGIYALQLFSHKVLRRLTPFLLVLLLGVSLALAPRGPLYLWAAVLQVAFYGLAALAWLVPAARKVPGATVPLFFVIGHAAMGLGVLNMLRGKRSDRWTPVREG